MAKRSADKTENRDSGALMASRASDIPGGTMSTIVMAEMLLLQAVVESAAVIGDGLDELGAQLSSKEPAQRSISSVLIRTANAALEPYTTSLQHLQELQELQELR